MQLQLHQQVQGLFRVVITAAATRFGERHTVDPKKYLVQNIVPLIWGSGAKVPLGMNYCSGCSSIPIMLAAAIAPTGTGTFQSGNHGSSSQIRGVPHCGPKSIYFV